MSAVDYCTKGDVRSLAEVLQLNGPDPQPVDQLTDNGDTLLTLACTNGQEEMANALIGWGASVNHTNKVGQTPLILAALTGLETSCAMLISGKADVLARDRNLGSALHNACCKGMESTVQLLLESKAEVDCTNKFGNTPLIEVCSLGFPAIASQLLVSGCEPNVTNKTGACALMKAIDKGHTEIVQLLLGAELQWDVLVQNGGLPQLATLISTNGVDVEWSAAESGRSILHDLAKCEANEQVAALIEQLIAQGAAVNAVTAQNEAPLHIALQFKQVATAQQLISHKAELNIQTTEGTFPLHLAAQAGDSGLIKQMLAMDPAQIGVADKHSRTALFFAVQSSEQAVALDLIQAGSSSQDCNMRDEQGRSMVHLAIEHQMTQLVPALLATADDLTQRDNEGCTVLHAAVASGVLSTVEPVLLRTGNARNLDLANNDGMTSVLIAVKACDVPMAKLLIEKGAAIDAVNSSGDTAIHLAVCQPSAASAEMLRQVLEWTSSKVDINTQNNLGMSAVHIACQQGNTDAAQLLLRQGADFELKDFAGNRPIELVQDGAASQILASWVPIKLVYPCNVHRFTLPPDIQLNEFLPIVKRSVGEDVKLLDSGKLSLTDASFKQQLAGGATIDIDPDSIPCPAKISQDLLDGKYLLDNRKWVWTGEPSFELGFDVVACRRVQLSFLSSQEQFDRQLMLHSSLGGQLTLGVLDNFVDLSQSLFVIVTEWGDITLDQYIQSSRMQTSEIALVIHSLAAILLLHQSHELVEMALRPNRVVRVGKQWKVSDFSRLVESSQWTHCPPLASSELEPVHGKASTAIYISPEEAAALQTTDAEAAVLAKPEIPIFHLGLITVELIQQEPCFTQQQAGVIFEMLSYKSLSPLWSKDSGDMAPLLEGLLCCEPTDRMTAADLHSTLGSIIGFADNTAESYEGGAPSRSGGSKSTGGSIRMGSSQHEQNQELRQLQRCVNDLQTQFKDSSHRHMIALQALEEQQKKSVSAQDTSSSSCSAACAIQ